VTNVLPAIAELRAIDRWVAWHWEKVNGKDTKPPFVASNGSRASVSDPTTWMPYAEAVKAYKKAGHVGLGLMVTDTYCGVDFDHCRDKVTGDIDAWAMAKVKALDSYTEITPSGEGLRTWVKARKTGTACAKAMKGSNGAKADAKIEIYDHDRYFTVTENHLAGTPDTIYERQEELAALEQEIWPPQQVQSPIVQVAVGPSLTAQQVIGLMKKAKNWPKFDALMRGDMSEYNNDESRGDEALCCGIAFYSRDPDVIDQVMRMGKPGEREKWNRADYRKLTIDRALAKVTETYRARVLAPTLPDEFWNVRAELRLIRQAAYSRELSADAVLGAVLARVSAGAAHQLRIPAIVTAVAYLSLLVNLIGGPSSGKSGANDVAGEVLPFADPVDYPGHFEVIGQLPIGSGEGLVEALFIFKEVLIPGTTKTKRVKHQEFHNAHFYVDEGVTATTLGERSGSVLVETLRTIWSGGTLGQSNASEDRKRKVEKGQYNIGVCMALQPEAAGKLLAGAPVGTPQRFVWFSATDPNMPDVDPPWPFSSTLPLRLPDWREISKGGPHEIVVARSIWNEIQVNTKPLRRGEVELELMQAHADLLRLKLAALLAILAGRLEVNDQDWQLAGMIKSTSDGVREYVQQEVSKDEARKESATSKRLSRRQVDAVSAVDQHRTVECAERIRTKVKVQPGVTAARVREGLTPRLRDAFEDGLEYAVAEKWVVEKAEAGLRGQTKRTLWPVKGGK
jgi:hypothetical protein